MSYGAITASVVRVTLAAGLLLPAAFASAQLPGGSSGTPITLDGHGARPPIAGHGPTGTWGDYVRLADEPTDEPIRLAGFVESARLGGGGGCCAPHAPHCDSCGGGDTCGGKDTCGDDDCDACKKKAEEKKKALAAAVAGAYKPLFYDNNFSYLDDPAYNEWWPGDSLKRLTICDWASFDFGGQYRARQHAERNMRGLGLTGNDDDFLLHRTRLFANAQIGEVRFFGEYIDALSRYEDFNPRPIEENRSDFLNLFVDAPLLTFDEGTLSGRVGRQELLYTDQRTVSPLDWANTRRTFDGFKLAWSGEDWNVDGFWTQPVQVNPHQFDAPYPDQQFYGMFGTYKGQEGKSYDLYWLAFQNDLTGFRAHSVGGRYLGSLTDGLLFECWGNYQMGADTDGSSHSAGAWTLGLGHEFEHPWKPALWVYYDWASGGNRLGAGDGYFQYFPLAHKYLGFMDLFARSNIESPNVLFTCQPHDRVKLLAWYYYLFLETTRDTPYNVNGAPFQPGIAPGSADLGHEIDFLVTLTINARSELWFGYSHFFSGKYYNTPGLPYSGDADFFYTQYHFNF